MRALRSRLGGLLSCAGLLAAAALLPACRTVERGAAAAPAAPAPSPGPSAEKTTAPGEITLYALAEVHGFPEPCGCTSAPLGDVARIAALVREGGGRALLLDAGGLRYDEGAIPEERRAQARLKADFLERTWAALPAPGAVVGLQPEDLAGGAAELRGAARVSANVQVPGLQLQKTALREVGGVKVGVLSVSDPGGPWPQGARAEEPRAAAQQAAAALKKEGAQLVVALTGLGRPAARRLAAAVPDLDVVVAGDRVGDGVEDAEQVGKALLLVPAREGQRLARLRLRLDDKGRPVLRLFPGPAAQARRAARLSAEEARLSDQLALLKQARDADPAFLRRTEEELAEVRKDLATARRESKLAPPAGGYASFELLPVTRALPRDPGVAKAMAELDRRVGEENLRQVKGPPPPPPAGLAAYVGNAACLGSCHEHDEAHDFWKKTVHSHAWKTLVDVGKQYSYDCAGCHSTGFEVPGGANLFTLAAADKGQLGPGKGGKKALPDLRNVGCEVCHGPGSRHVQAPSKNPMPPPVKERCLDCHTKDHSDTFEPSAYRRDILGPGHGEEARKALGPGPTGAELRRAALGKH